MKTKISQNQHFSGIHSLTLLPPSTPTPPPLDISPHTLDKVGFTISVSFIFLDSAFFIQQHSWQIQITKSSKRDNQNDIFKSIFIAVSNPDQSYRISHDNNHLLLTMTTIKARRAKLMIENYYSNLLLQQHQRSPAQLYLYSSNKY